MVGRRKLIVVSNRGPVSYARDASGTRVARRGSGGLATALRNLLARHDVTWIASAMSDEDREVAREHGGEAFEEQARDGSSYRLHLVEHDAAVYERFYTVAANPTLWFVQHSLWDLAYAPDFDDARHDAWSAGYVPVNAAFAAATVAESIANRGPRCCSRTTTCTSHRAWCGASGRIFSARTSSTCRGRTRARGRCFPTTFAATCTRASSRTTSSAFTRSGGVATSCARAPTSSARRWTATSCATPAARRA